MIMQIKHNNGAEEKQILDVLLDLGYLFHNQETYKTSDEIVHQWNGFNYVEVGYNATKPRSIQLSKTAVNELSWSKDFKEIMANLTNFKLVPEKPSQIRIDDVGDYHANVTKDGVRIHDEILPHDMVKEIYSCFDQIEGEYTKELHITVSNNAERKALLGLIFAMGWSYNDEELEEAAEDLEGYGSIVIRSNLSMGANYRYYNSCAEPELFMSKDLSEIYNELVKMTKSIVKLPDIGEYTVLVKATTVSVGCQVISKEKVKEIVNAIDSFKH